MIIKESTQKVINDLHENYMDWKFTRYNASKNECIIYIAVGVGCCYYLPSEKGFNIIEQIMVMYAVKRAIGKQSVDKLKENI